MGLQSTNRPAHALKTSKDFFAIFTQNFELYGLFAFSRLVLLKVFTTKCVIYFQTPLLPPGFILVHILIVQKANVNIFSDSLPWFNKTPQDVTNIHFVSVKTFAVIFEALFWRKTDLFGFWRAPSASKKTLS